MISIYIQRAFYNESPYNIGGWKNMPCWPKYFNYKRPYEIYTDIDQYLQSSNKIKIAFNVIDHRSPSDKDPGQVRQREKDKIISLCRSSNLVFTIETEVIEPVMIKEAEFKNLNNLYWIMAGIVDDYKDRIIPWQYHIWRIVELYKNFPDALTDQLSPYAPKPRYFDAMLGTRKPHREFVSEQIANCGLTSKITHTIGPMPGDDLTVPMNQGSEFIWDPEFEPLPDMDYLKLNQHIKYRGMNVQMPCILPTQLFNSTAYSIICETGFENGTHMLSEKTAKALLGRRLFVMFAGAGALKFIRSEGFKTFDSIIDESYDDIEDDQQRWAAAFEQVKRLCSMDQQEVLQRVQPICDHNFKYAKMDLEFVPKSTVYHIIQNMLNNF